MSYISVFFFLEYDIHTCIDHGLLMFQKCHEMQKWWCTKLNFLWATTGAQNTTACCFRELSLTKGSVQLLIHLLLITYYSPSNKSNKFKKIISKIRQSERPSIFIFLRIIIILMQAHTWSVKQLFTFLSSYINYYSQIIIILN